MQDNSREEALQRLATIQELIKQIRVMVQDDQYCVDILHQALVIRKALEELESGLLQGHIQSCVPERVRAGQEEQVIQELLQLYTIAGNR